MPIPTDQTTIKVSVEMARTMQKTLAEKPIEQQTTEEYRLARYLDARLGPIRITA